MRRHIALRMLRSEVIGCLVVIISAAPAAAGDDEPADRTSASRLRAVREIMQEIKVESTAADEPQPLEFHPDPLLRYNDATRGILDSCIFRVGSEGRPLALVSAELYGREGNRFLLNHEFIALHEPAVRMRRDQFVWEPGQGNLTFQELPDAQAPASNAGLRLAQMRRLAERFSASQEFRDSVIHLRRLATPLDRYQPSDEPYADGAVFAYVWGVNPEALLFIETDGETWVYGWAPLSSAPLEAELDGELVWHLPAATEHESRRAPYTSIYRRLTVPDYFDDEIEESREGE